MAKKLYEESNIQAIADAIRAKNGETTTYKTSEMADAISAITTGGSGIEVEPIVLSGDCKYGCSGQLAHNYINLFGNTITTENIISCESMFRGYKNEIIPFEINGYSNTDINLNEMFTDCNYLIQIPKINNIRPSTMNYLFYNCNRLRYLPNDIAEWFDWSSMTTKSTANRSNMFRDCYSLRSIPMDFLASHYPSIRYSYSIYYSGFWSCYALDEIVGLPIPYTATWTSNAFSYSFSACFRLKNLIFETNEDGTPKIVNWKNQTIDLTTVGHRYYGSGNSSETWDPTSNQFIIYVNNAPEIIYNSGITSDKMIYNAITYATLKDDPDAWCLNGSKNPGSYSRYNRTSAVATINSLPDTSAYLTANGGTNTIKFKGEAGSATDGGAINTMTEEEIAMAAARGWTVTFV